MNTQKTFGALWDYANEIREGSLSLGEAESKTKQDCDVFCKEKRRQGFKVVRSSLGKQLRQYWGFGMDCGLTCKSWVVNVYEPQEEI